VTRAAARPLPGEPRLRRITTPHAGARNGPCRPKGDDRRRGVWDRDDRRILTPKNYGWGYGINFAALLRRLTRR
jgi:Family of unknown function (DUF5808)